MPTLWSGTPGGALLVALGCTQNSPATGADVSLCLSVQCQKRLGGREGSLDRIAGQVTTCLFFSVVPFLSVCEKNPSLRFVTSVCSAEDCQPCAPSCGQPCRISLRCGFCHFAGKQQDVVSSRHTFQHSGTGGTEL